MIQGPNSPSPWTCIAASRASCKCGDEADDRAHEEREHAAQEQVADEPHVEEPDDDDIQECPHHDDVLHDERNTRQHAEDSQPAQLADLVEGPQGLGVEDLLTLGAGFECREPGGEVA